jgi:16S rRNA (guanine527-N7)-methyltransferase
MFQANLLSMSQIETVALFGRALRQQEASYGIELSPHTQEQLATYYELLLRWNQRLHLVAPCSPEEFAGRHVLESLAVLDHLPEGAAVTDVGSGAGLPIIPCLIARTDITATLIESSQKKSVFLREALKTVEALNRAKIVSRRFEESQPPKAEFITCRALDDFTSQLDALIRWAPEGSTLLLFGGDNLRERLTAFNYPFTQSLLPQSDRRFLFEVTRSP